MKENPKSIINILSVLAFIILCILALVHLINISKQDKLSLRNELSKKSILELKYNYDFLNPDIELLNLQNERELLGDVVNSNKLIFRFSVLHCSSCVYEKNNELDSMYKTGITDIIVLAQYDELRNLLINYKENHYTLPVYILSKSGLIKELDKLNVPQFILLNRDLQIQ